jgi:hypothetical protein
MAKSPIDGLAGRSASSSVSKRGAGGTYKPRAKSDGKLAGRSAATAPKKTGGGGKVAAAKAAKSPAYLDRSMASEKRAGQGGVSGYMGRGAAEKKSAAPKPVGKLAGRTAATAPSKKGAGGKYTPAGKKDTYTPSRNEVAGARATMDLKKRFKSGAPRGAGRSKGKSLPETK